jgi:hypothetical protein
MMFPPISIMRLLAIALMVIALLGLLESQNLSSANPQIWVADSVERIGLKDSPGDTSNIKLYAARGEYESFQIAIKAPKEGLKVLDIEVSDLQGFGDRAIAKNNITLYREQYVHVTKPSPTWRGSTIKPLGKGWYPDGLIPFVNPQTGEDLASAELDAVPFDLKKRTNQPIWVDVFVPGDARAGEYRGKFTVKSDQGEVEGNILLEVWDFELPLKPSLKSAFLSWEQQDKNTLIELLKHKVMPVAKINPADQRELIDRWGLSSLRLPFWSGANHQNCSMKSAPSAAEIRQAGIQHQLDLMLYVYPTDEIDDCENLLQPLKEWGKNIHQAGVKHLAVMAPIPELYDLVDIWVVDPRRYNANPKRVSEVLKQGKEVWFYTYLAPGGDAPNWQIDFEPINYRIPHGFINQSLGLTGVLYWRVDWWTNDPWNNVNAHSQNDEHYPGEGMLVYPGKTVGIEGVVPSMRLKWIRDGVEDYEYIQILKRLGWENWALTVSRSVGADWKHWTKNPQVLETARIKLGNKIEQLFS